MVNRKKMIIVFGGCALATLALCCCGVQLLPSSPPAGPRNAGTSSAAASPSASPSLTASPSPSRSPSPSPTPTRSPAPAKTSEEPEEPEGNAYYASCAEARRAGVTPLYRGDPGYRSGLDRDKDGVACE